jgi:hypothetical protein
MIHLRFAGGIVLCAALFTGLAQAQEEPEGFHRIHAAVFLGGTHHSERNAFTFGGDVEWRFSRWAGIGFTGEHVNKPFRENVWIFPVFIHATRGLRFNLGPGFERATEEEIAEGEAAGTPSSRTVRKAMFRTGVTYDFELKHGWTVGPDIAVDFIAGEAVFVYGIAIGHGFARR